MVSMRTIAITEFKARCLELIAAVERTGEELQITKRGRPIARVVAAQPESHRYKVGHFAKEIQVREGIDLVNLSFSDEWEG